MVRAASSSMRSSTAPPAISSSTSGPQRWITNQNGPLAAFVVESDRSGSAQSEVAVRSTIGSVGARRSRWCPSRWWGIRTVQASTRCGSSSAATAKGHTGETREARPVRKRSMVNTDQQQVVDGRDVRSDPSPEGGRFPGTPQGPGRFALMRGRTCPARGEELSATREVTDAVRCTRMTASPYSDTA